MKFKDGNIKEYLGDIDFYLEREKGRGISSNRKKQTNRSPKRKEKPKDRHVNFEDQKKR